MESLETRIPAVHSRTDVVKLFTHQPILRDYIFSRPAYPNDSAFVDTLFHRFSNPHFDTLLMETQRVFGDGSALKDELATAFSNLHYYFPDYQLPRVQTAITGMESDVFITDSLVVIGLDYYLGEGARYRPVMYDYILRRYQRNFVVPSVMLLIGISGQLNKVDEQDHTALADMITYGKAYYFAKQMLPCTPDSVLLGYTSREMEGCKKFEGLIWYRLIEDQVLYSNVHAIKQKFLGERPKTLEVGNECPGRIGMWVGWQIVSHYMKEHPEVSLSELMQTASAQKIFKESRYKPKYD
ncbi:MAG: gliding motility lipoprotein GldB [Cyclobacteriaceae bacterium]|nr:gliding motility lipoprotein GldB [Cyclobacteriaceae bacterium]